MSMGLMFWIIMLVWLIIGGVGAYNAPAGSSHYGLGNNLMLFVLLVLLGWQVFGAPIH